MQKSVLLKNIRLFWVGLEPDAANLAENITVSVEWVGGRESASKLLGCSVATLDNYRAGKTQPSAIDALRLLSAALHAEARPHLDEIQKIQDQKKIIGRELAASRDAFSKAFEKNAELQDNQIPVYGTAAGSFTGSVSIQDNVIDWIPRPKGLQNAQHAYALYVTGSSMEPKFLPGDIIFLHPGRPPRTGDIVVVQTENYDGADTISFVKEYVRKSDFGIVTKQYNALAEVEFKRETIKAVHRVMTTNELLGV